MQSESLLKNTFKIIFQKHKSFLNSSSGNVPENQPTLFLKNIATNKFRNFIWILVSEENTDLKQD